MPEGGCLLTVTFFGSERVVPHYCLMGPVKAALESAMRYTAAELGLKGIRAHAVSPGPICTRAAGGLPVSRCWAADESALSQGLTGSTVLGLTVSLVTGLWMSGMRFGLSLTR
jgi:enoyl-[acyl-carrier-protein] reductase (NADH)